MIRFRSNAPVALTALACVAWSSLAWAGDAAAARAYLAKARAELLYSQALPTGETRIAEVKDAKRLEILLALAETEASDLADAERDAVAGEIAAVRRDLLAYRDDAARRHVAVDLERRFDRLLELIGTKWAFDAEALAIAEYLFTDPVRKAVSPEELGAFRARLATFRKTSDRMAHRRALEQLEPLCADLERQLGELEPSLRSLSDVARRQLVDKVTADVERLRAGLVGMIDPTPTVPLLWKRYNAICERLDRVVEDERIVREVASVLYQIEELERRCTETLAAIRAGRALDDVGAAIRLVETQLFVMPTRIKRLPQSCAAIPELMARHRALGDRYTEMSGSFAELTLADQVTEAAESLRRELDLHDQAWAGRKEEVVGSTWSDYRKAPSDNLRRFDFNAPVTIAYLDSLRRFLADKHLALARIHPARNAPAVRAQLDRATKSRDGARAKLVKLITALVAEMERTDLAKDDLATASRVVDDLRFALGADTDEAMTLSWRVQKLIERAGR